ncbi:MAG: hypothetical protein ACRDOO_25015 [Actinomadura sp.]
MSKTWLITGSSRGLGREPARGERLVATARKPEQPDEQASRSRATKAQRWAALSRSTDFEGSTGITETAVARLLTTSSGDHILVTGRTARFLDRSFRSR